MPDCRGGKYAQVQKLHEVTIQEEGGSQVTQVLPLSCCDSVQRQSQSAKPFQLL